MLQRAVFSAFVVFLLVLCLLSVHAMADDSCPIKLQESQTQSLIIAQSRDQYEQRLAQAIRANHELSGIVDKASAEITKLKAELAALKPKADEHKAEPPKP